MNATKEKLITGHEQELSAIAQGRSQKEMAIASLEEAIRILRSDSPSLLSQLYGTEDAPGWREESAAEYIRQALKDLGK